MKPTLLFKFSLFLVFITLSGCGPSDSDMEKLKTEKTDILGKSKSMTAGPAEIQRKAQKLLDAARADFRDGRYPAAREKLTALIEQYPALETAKEARALLLKIKDAQEKKAVKDYFEMFASTNGLRMKLDSDGGVGLFKDQRTTRYKNINAFYIYFGKRKGEPPWLRLRIRYFDNHWLSTQSYIVLADNHRYVKPLARFKQSRDTAGYSELYDNRVTGDDIDMIQAVVASKKAIVRLYGKEASVDVIITPLEKEAMKNVLAAFKKMGGRF